MVKKQHYMTKDERTKLEALLQADLPITQIARQLGFCRQTIYNEIKVGAYLHTCANLAYKDEERYSAQKSQAIHRNRQSAKGRPFKIGHDRAYANFLEDKIIKDKYSPAAALATARKAGYKTSVCTATLYSYIDKGIFLHLTNKHLWEKSRRRKHGYRPVHRIAHPLLPSITERPQHITDRQDYGHWEMDLVVSKTGSKAALLTLTERISRQELIFKLSDKKAATVKTVFDRLERSMPDFKKRFQSPSWLVSGSTPITPSSLYGNPSVKLLLSNVDIIAATAPSSVSCFASMSIENFSLIRAVRFTMEPLPSRPSPIATRERCNPFPSLHLASKFWPNVVSFKYVNAMLCCHPCLIVICRPITRAVPW